VKSTEYQTFPVLKFNQRFRYYDCICIIITSRKMILFTWDWDWLPKTW